MSLVALMLLPLLACPAFTYPTGIDASLGVDAGLNLGVGLGAGASLDAGVGLGTGSGAGLGLDLGVGLGTGAGAGLGLGVGLGSAGGYGNVYTSGQGLKTWPYDTYGPLIQNSILDYANPLAYGAEVYPSSYFYDDYPRSVDYARENYIRRYPVVAPEVGTRDLFTVRPSYFGAPYSRYYNSYFPYNYYGGGFGWRGAY